MIAAGRLRKGACHSARGAHRLIADNSGHSGAVAAGPGVGPDTAAGGFGVLRPPGGHHRDRCRRAGIGHGSSGHADTRSDRRDRRRGVDSDRVPRRRLRRGQRAVGFFAPRSPTSSSPRSRPQPRACRFPAGWSYAGSPLSVTIGRGRPQDRPEPCLLIPTPLSTRMSEPETSRFRGHAIDAQQGGKRSPH